MKRVTIAGFLIAAMTLVACGADDATPTDAPEAPGTVSTGEDLLAAHDLDGLTGAEIVDALDQDPRERPLPVAASVFYDEVVVMDDDVQVAVPIDNDLFYVSFAPYQTFTHPCTYHALGGCQGEMVGETFHVTITAEDGEVLVDEEATTYTNGFIGFWIPRDINATLAVSYEDGTSAEDQISTFDGDATCVTTLELT